MIKYDKNEAYKFFKKHGYEMNLSSFTKASEECTLSDKEGYLYYVKLFSFRNVIDSNTTLMPVSSRNPFSIENINNWFFINNKNFRLIEGEYISAISKNLLFKCEKCSTEIYSSWNDIRRKYNCESPICMKEYSSTNNHKQRATNLNNLLSSFPDICKEWDYENNKYSPEYYAPFSGKIVYWICTKCKNNYKSKISNRTKHNSSCPSCNTSKGEANIERYLRSNDIKYFSQHKFSECKNKKPLPFDFYIPSLNSVIEYNGEQHYVSVDFFRGEEGFIQRKINDNIKKQYCLKNNITFIEISYLDFKIIDKILDKKLTIQ